MIRRKEDHIFFYKKITKFQSFYSKIGISQLVLGNKLTNVLNFDPKRKIEYFNQNINKILKFWLEERNITFFLAKNITKFQHFDAKKERIKTRKKISQHFKILLEERNIIIIFEYKKKLKPKNLSEEREITIFFTKNTKFQIFYKKKGISHSFLGNKPTI